VQLDGHGRVSSFREKQGIADTYVNAGIYVISRQMLNQIPPWLEVSLEQELFPRWLRDGKYIKGFIYSGPCVDIGTPERYRNAQNILASAEVNTNEPQRQDRL
jgi:NDP-sugar pyrophosphorylase family protein